LAEKEETQSLAEQAKNKTTVNKNITAPAAAASNSTEDMGSSFG
jgi:hypothetical protein